MKVSEYALSFIKDYRVTDINRESLEIIIQKLGYRLIKYNLLFNNKETEELIQSLNLEKITKQKQCFTYKTKVLKIVFIRDDINDIDSIPVLLHEIGHIYMCHIKSGLTEDEVHYENEANQFASLVTDYFEKNNKNQKIASAFLWASILILSIVTLLLCIKTAYNVDSEHKNKAVINSSSLITHSTTTVSTAPTKTKSKNSDNSNNDIYYVTSSGTKYHKEWCSAIKNRTNVSYGTRKGLEDMGYEPCQLCCGDE